MAFRTMAASGESICGIVIAASNLCVICAVRRGSMSAARLAANSFTASLCELSSYGRGLCMCCVMDDRWDEDDNIGEIDPESERVGVGGSIDHTLDDGEGKLVAGPTRGDDRLEVAMAEDEVAFEAVESPELFVNTLLDAALVVLVEDVDGGSVVPMEGLELVVDRVADERGEVDGWREAGCLSAEVVRPP